MDDLIDRKALLEPMKLQKEALDKIAPKEVAKWYDYAIWEIQQAPTIDAEPVKRGRWIKEPDRSYHWHCSECGFVEGIRVEIDIYCPHCGAKNGGVNDD